MASFSSESRRASATFDVSSYRVQVLFGFSVEGTEEYVMVIVSIATSKKKGTTKVPRNKATVIKDRGLEGDAHAGSWHRQVSLLATEQIEEARRKGLDVSFGDFAENVATAGIDWKTVPVGTHIKLGSTVILEITQIGKECHSKCAIYYKAGDCIMPREGVFARVLVGGEIRRGDHIAIIKEPDGDTTPAALKEF